jgi:hypothetical protein
LKPPCCTRWSVYPELFLRNIIRSKGMFTDMVASLSVPTSSRWLVRLLWLGHGVFLCPRGHRFKSDLPSDKLFCSSYFPPTLLPDVWSSSSTSTVGCFGGKVHLPAPRAPECWSTIKPSQDQIGMFQANMLTQNRKSWLSWIPCSSHKANYHESLVHHIVPHHSTVQRKSMWDAGFTNR